MFSTCQRGVAIGFIPKQSRQLHGCIPSALLADPYAKQDLCLI